MADESATEVHVEAEQEPTHDGGLKRLRADAEDDEQGQKVEAKKSRVDEEESAVEEKHGNEESESAPVSLGPKDFGSAVEMFDYFYKLLHFWPPNLSLNKYEHMVLLELLRKGHLESQRKIGVGVKYFQVRNHPQFKSRCFFIIREDDSVEDFSFRKCVNHILPLPEDMHQIKHHANKAPRGRGGGNKWRGRGRGRR